MLICEDCEKANNSVKFRVDPYVEEIHGERVEKFMCDDCYKQACLDI